MVRQSSRPLRRARPLPVLVVSVALLRRLRFVREVTQYAKRKDFGGRSDGEGRWRGSRKPPRRRLRGAGAGAPAGEGGTPERYGRRAGRGGRDRPRHLGGRRSRMLRYILSPSR